ncbi:MAG: hypothetical protein QW724_04660 [Nitrososphaerota archaeon]
MYGEVFILRIPCELKARRLIAVDETKLKLKEAIIYLSSAIDVDSGELLGFGASYDSVFNAIILRESSKSM